jgi:hypothetical protein
MTVFFQPFEALKHWICLGDYGIIILNINNYVKIYSTNIIDSCRKIPGFRFNPKEYFLAHFGMESKFFTIDLLNFRSISKDEHIEDVVGECLC